MGGVPTSARGVPTLAGGVPISAGGGVPTSARGYLPWLVEVPTLAEGVPTLAGGYLPKVGVPPVDRQTPVKTVPTHHTTYVGGKNPSYLVATRP